MALSRQKILLLSALLPFLSGCLMHTHRVQQVRIPPVLKEAGADQLVKQVNELNGMFDSLSATVDFQASVGGALKGSVTDYTALSGYILLRKPNGVHVVGLVPVIRTRAFELASDGKGFELYIPPQNRVIEGSDTVVTPSPKPLENLRPAPFFRAMIPQAIGPDELVTLTNANIDEEDPVTHAKETIPEYALTVLRQKPGSQELRQQRVVHFSRVDLQLMRVDSYDSKGTLETVTSYGASQTFDGGVQYPKTITIRWPQSELQVVVTVDKLARNPALTDDQLGLKLPDGVQVQKLP